LPFTNTVHIQSDPGKVVSTQTYHTILTGIQVFVSVLHVCSTYTKAAISGVRKLYGSHLSFDVLEW